MVIPCYRQERFLPRTLAALESIPQGWNADGVIVLAAPAGRHWTVPLPRWRAIATPPGADRAPLTPGAARMAGLAACAGEWVLFVDADVEMDPRWLDRSLECVASLDPDSRLAGLWGRIAEWFEDAGRTRPGNPDLYRLGAGDRAVDYLATFALYRRAALLDAGGYDPRLSSEEDFELGMRLRSRGWELRTLAPVAARHWSAPRPSFAELSRRWSTGLCFGQGQVLRLYLGRRGFAPLLRRQMHYVATLLMWALGVAALGGTLARSSPAPLIAWLTLPLSLLAVMTVRKHSLRLATHSVLTWTLGGLGLVVGWFRIDVRAQEGAC